MRPARPPPDRPRPSYPRETPFRDTNLAIALYTPPVGGTLFVAAKLAGAGIGEITKALMPLLIAAIIALFIITYVPSLTTVVWRLLI